MHGHLRKLLSSRLCTPTELALALHAPIGTYSIIISTIAGGPGLTTPTMLLHPMYGLQQAPLAVAPVLIGGCAKKASNNLRHQCDADRDPYEPDIDADLRSKERDPREHPDPNYMSTTQRGHMSPSMRADLVLWMDAFARHLGDLPPGTICRAVTYLDRVLTARPVPAHDEALRLIAAAAVFLGAKVEGAFSGQRLDSEVVDAFVGTTVAAVEAMEREIVEDLGYVMDGPTAYTFIERFTRFFEREDEFLVRSIAFRLVDLTLPEFGFVGRNLPSAVAASAMFLARQIMIMSVTLSDDLEEVTGYKAVELMDCIGALVELLPKEKA